MKPGAKLLLAALAKLNPGAHRHRHRHRHRQTDRVRVCACVPTLYSWCDRLDTTDTTRTADWTLKPPTDLPPHHSVSAKRRRKTGGCCGKAGKGSVAVKVVVVGDGECGKSSLIQRYCSGTLPSPYNPTLFHTNTVHVTVQGTQVSSSMLIGGRVGVGLGVGGGGREVLAACGDRRCRLRFVFAAVFVVI